MTAGPGQVVLDIPASSAMVGTARLLVSCLASARRELSADRVDDLKLAVSEACSNAIESYGPRRDSRQPDTGSAEPRVSVTWAEDPDGLSLWVTDQGRGFDPDRFDPSDGAPDGSGGLGMGLIEALVDKVAFTSGRPGTTVQMTIYCPPARAEGY